MFPRSPFVPEWVPDWLLIASTLLLAAALVAAIWWRFVRRTARGRRAELIFWAIVLAGALATAAALDSLFVRVDSWSSGGFSGRVFDHDHRPAAVSVYCQSARSLLLGREQRQVEITITPHDVHVTGRTRPTFEAESVWVTVDGVPSLLAGRRADDVLDELWLKIIVPQHGEARRIWSVLRASRLAREDSDMARVLEQYDRD